MARGDTRFSDTPMPHRCPHRLLVEQQQQQQKERDEEAAELAHEVEQRGGELERRGQELNRLHAVLAQKEAALQELAQREAELKQQVLEVFDKTFAITYSLEIIAILVAVLGLFNTLVSLILERKRKIGILRFIGAFKGQVKRMVLIEAGILGLIGSVMGFIAGVVVSYILIFVINKQSFGWTIQVHFPYLFILVMVTMFCGVSILSVLYPARLAANLNPKEAVRVE